MKIDDSTGLKVCSHCKASKPAEDFGKNKNLSDGLCDYCLDCSSLYGKETYMRYQEKYQTNQRTWQNAARLANPEWNLLSRCKERAKRKSVLCTMTVADIQIPENCPVCGKLISFRYPGSPLDGQDYPSVDRYDPTLGYIPGNVWIICVECNRRKGDMTGEDHIQFGQILIDAWQARTNGV